MPLLRDGAVIADGWAHLDGVAAVPDDGVAITVDGARWAAERQALIGRSGPVHLGRSWATIGVISRVPFSRGWRLAPMPGR